MQQVWDEMGKGLEIEPPAPLGLYLGCKHEYFEATGADGKPAKGRSYNQEEFLQSCIDRYMDLSGCKKLG